MPAPDPSFVVANPPPLNPHRRFPFRVDVFDADLVLNSGGLAGTEEYQPQTAEENPQRFAD